MKKSVKVGVIALIIVALIALWYLASPLFINKTVNEESPSGSQIALLSGTFNDADSFHKVSGMAKIINDGDNTILRFVDFDATNGPDLKVYLSKDIEAKDYVSLGDLKGNKGNQNYDLVGVNYEDYDYVLIWCEAFHVLFGYSKIN